MTGDYNGAKTTLTNFFSGIFRDQVTATGEQPFEAIRTRPYHYRAFNLEAIIVNAKLADQLGLNMWSAKSKYNATIQSAIDFTMRLDPKGEDANEMVPHVLCAVAVYGDPKNTYMTWVKKVMPDYDTRIYHIYNQPGAFVTSPVSARQKAAGGSGSTGSAPSSSAAAPNNGKRDLETFDQHVMQMQMDLGGAGAATSAIRQETLNETAASPEQAVEPDSGRNEQSPIDIDPRAVSDWHSIADFTWLAPPLRLAKRLADQATSFWTGGTQQMNKQQQGQSGKGETLAGTYKDVLHMREENGPFTD